MVMGQLQPFLKVLLANRVCQTVTFTFWWLLTNFELEAISAYALDFYVTLMVLLSILKLSVAMYTIGFQCILVTQQLILNFHYFNVTRGTNSDRRSDF